MHNRKLSKKQPQRTWQRRGPFAKTSRRKENKSWTTLLMKWFSNMRRNSFVSNNSRMSIDRPKPANCNTRTVYVWKCYNWHCISKTAKKTKGVTRWHLCNVMVVILFIKVYLMVLIEVFVNCVIDIIMMSRVNSAIFALVMDRDYIF